MVLTRGGIRGLVMVAAAIFSAGVMPGCELYRVVKEARSATAPAQTIAAGLEVKTRNGHISIATGQVEEIEITALLKARNAERLAQIRVTAEQSSDGVLVIEPQPPTGGWKSNEGCEIDIVLPTSATLTALKARSSNGRISIQGLTGAAKLATSNGRIVVVKHAGTIEADTSNGRIEIEDAMGAVMASTSNGSVDVRLHPTCAGPVEIETSNGSVGLDVGPAFAGTFSCRTSNGSVDLPAGWKSGATIGSGGAPSKIRTSNGSIRVRLLKG